MKSSPRTAVVLVVCLVVTGAWVAAGARKRKPAGPNSSVGIVSAAAVLPQASVVDRASAPRMDLKHVAQASGRWMASTGPDPFADAPAVLWSGPVGAALAATNLVISGIWCQPGHRMSVVNGRILQEGSVLSSFQVQRIERDAVVFSGPGGPISLPVTSSSTRARAADAAPSRPKITGASGLARSSGG